MDAHHVDETPQVREVLDLVDGVVFSADAEGRWTYLSDGWERLTGRRVADTLGESFLESLVPQERQRTLRLFEAVVTGSAAHCHHRTMLRTTAGHVRPAVVDLFAQPVRDERGAIVRNIGFLLDVGEEVTAGDVLQEHRRAVELVSPSTAAEELPIGLVLVGSDGAVREVSAAALRLLDGVLTSGSVLGDASDAVVDPGTGRRGLERLVSDAQTLRTPRTAVLATTRGPLRLLHASVIPESDTDDVTLVLQDVTSLHQTGRQHDAVARLGRTALDAATLRGILGEAVATVAGTLQVPYVVVLESDGPRTLTTRAAHGWAGAPPNAVWSLHVDAGTVLDRALEAVGPVVVADVAAEPSLSRQPALRASRDGSAAWVPIRRHGRAYGLLGVLTATPRQFRADEAAFLEAVAQVIASAVGRLEQEARIRSQALHDALTGLANRTLLQDRVEHALALRRRSGGRVALLVMDLDGFKEVNDTLGHAAGDRVLQVTARRIRDATRASDTVARLGGDEFAVVLTEVIDAADAVRAAGNLREAVSQPITVAGMRLTVEGSVGVAVAPDHGETQGELLRRADAAMYRAKRSATGVWTHSDADAAPSVRLGRLQALRAAVDGGQLVLHYQPEVDLRDGRVRSREALVRWQHPEEGTIPPRDFLPLAERSGMAATLTEYVLRRALADSQRWASVGAAGTVTVNLSPQSLTTGVVDVVRAVLASGDDGDAVPVRLQLDVPEAAIAVDPAGAVDALAALVECGARVSVDDFGAGPSLLPVLADLPVAQLKLHPTVVRRADGDASESAVVRRLLDLAHDLGHAVVAEGVESTSVLTALVALGCDAAQGFLLGVPEPFDTVMAAVTRDGGPGR